MCDDTSGEVKTEELENVALLIGCSGGAVDERIKLSHSEFLIGRSKTASYNILNIFVSKQHCKFQFSGGKWTVTDLSTPGTYINNERIEKNKPRTLNDGDEIKLGQSDLKYIFYSSTQNVLPPSKRPKQDFHIKLSETQRARIHKEMRKYHQRNKITDFKNLKRRHHTETTELQKKLKAEIGDDVHQNDVAKQIQELEAKHAEEIRRHKEELAKEKQLLEEKLKEMQRKLEEKEREESLLNKKLQEKEEQRVKDLEQQDAMNKVILESLKAEVTAKEETIRSQLKTEIQKLQEEKEKIENDIKHEQSTKGECAENLKRLTEELEKVKGELANTEGKKQLLEKELENTASRAQEQLTESSLKAKQEVLQNFGQLVESELQCSICNELFVIATTLNCTHTFCRMCISQWKKKKKDCPVCRAPIKSENRSIVLDTFIDRIVENLSKELRNRRQEIVEERQVQELLAVKSEASTSRQPGRQQRRQQNAGATERGNIGNPALIIEISSDSDPPSDIDSESFDDYMSSSSSIEGFPEGYYGGYGYCYNCGRRGHWVGGCPFR